MQQLHDYADDGYFQTRLAHDPARGRVWREVVAYLQPYLPAAGAVLDLGAGYCDFINQVQARERHAVDLYPRVGDYAAPGVTVHVQSAAALDNFPTAHFDTIFASNLLEHLTRAELAALAGGVRRLLKPGGYLVLVQPNYRLAYREYFDDYTHLQVFSDRSLPDFLAAHGLPPVRVEARFLPLTFKSRLPKPAWMVRLYLALPWRPLAGQMLVVAQAPSPALGSPHVAR